MKEKWHEIIIETNGTLLSGLMHISFIVFFDGLNEQLKVDYGTLTIAALMGLSYLLWIIIINVSIHWIKKRKSIKEVQE